jgi:hypothetical protein
MAYYNLETLDLSSFSHELAEQSQQTSQISLVYLRKIK